MCWIKCECALDAHKDNVFHCHSLHMVLQDVTDMPYTKWINNVLQSFLLESIEESD